MYCSNASDIRQVGATDKGYPFEVLSYIDSRVMKDYQLYFELPENLVNVYKKRRLDIEAFNGKGRTVLPVPGNFIIDGSGTVRAMQAEPITKNVWNLLKYWLRWRSYLVSDLLSSPFHLSYQGPLNKS